MILFVDDERTPNFSCTIVRNVEDAMFEAATGRYDTLYLDHDLGQQDVRWFVLFLEENFFNGNMLGIKEIVLHTQNPVGRMWMRGAFDKYVKVVDGRIET